MKESLEASFISLLENHKGIIYKVAHSYGKNPHDRKDLFQEIILNLWKSFPSFKGNSKISTWIYKVSLYTAITDYRRSRREIETAQMLFEPYDLFPDNLETASKDLVNFLYEAIDKLPSIDKAIILLVLDESSYSEIGEIIGFKPTAVAMRVKRAKDKLAKLLKNVKN
jgi:RNA polymerase sigma-70 factor (ECF subfamily)